MNSETRKEIARLDAAKWRRRSGLFKAEGTKCVLDTLDAFKVAGVYASAAWVEAHPTVRAEIVSRADLERISSLVTPPEVVAVYHLPANSGAVPRSGLVVALDGLQDPGNLGTIIRVADWYGIRDILCSDDTADCFAPKVVQATMGAISRVRLHYGLLPEMLRECGLPVFGTFLGGENIYAAELPHDAVIVIGNEGHGISEDTAACVTRRLTIPSYPAGEPTSESLNAAVAASVTISEFRRNLLK